MAETEQQHLLPESLRGLIPAGVRNFFGRMISTWVNFYRDSADLRETTKNLTPAVIANSFRFRRTQPTVTVVFTGRNDDYVADNEARIRAMIEWNSHIFRSEMIFVEWNPLPDRPLLSTSLTRDYPQLRAYVVPPEIHAQLCTNPKIVVMEEFGKNVGLRRATTEYACITNCYILWDEDMRRMLWGLNEKLVFRTRRIELRWNGEAVTKEYLSDPRNRGEYRRGWRQELCYACGDFVLAPTKLWHRGRGYDESLRDVRINADGRGLMQLLKIGGKSAHMGHHYHIFHGASSSQHGEYTKEDRFGATFPYWENLPFENPPTWGLGDCREELIAERVWMLRRPEANR